jgi:hypothetical protein
MKVEREKVVSQSNPRRIINGKEIDPLSNNTAVTMETF